MTSERRHANVVHLDEVKSSTESRGTKFGYASKILGAAAGGKGLGCSHYVVPPGKTAFPFHWHAAAEEALFILEGAGTLRIGDQRADVRAGDYVAFPTGPDCAHQLLNTGHSDLTYLCFSTSALVEVVGYPDSKKTGIRAVASVAEARAGKMWTRQIIKEQPSAGYYDGEEGG
jgi:uncharacterized cupin superfamily protein